MKKILLLILMGICLSNISTAQTDLPSPLKISGYLEAYYLYDFGNPADHNRPGFQYSYTRHNEINLNLGYIQAEYNNDKIRGKLALMTGTYANANLAAEPGVLRNVFEANAGVKISKSKNVWVDAGIFASHIGFESAIGANCWNMTRSILADNSPYYESGVKISYTSDNEQWFLSGLILNGWQRIQRLPGNQTPGFGHQLTWKPNDKIALNSSSFVGNDKPETSKQMRYFHNFYGQFQLTRQFGLIAGFDIGAEQIAKGSNDYNKWYSPVLIARFTPSNKLAIAARAEYYSDEGGVIIATGTPDGFKTFGLSLNLDVRIMENVLWRLEARTFNNQPDKIFLDSDLNAVNNNTSLGTSLSIAF